MGRDGGIFADRPEAWNHRSDSTQWPGVWREAGNLRNRRDSAW